MLSKLQALFKKRTKYTILGINGETVPGRLSVRVREGKEIKNTIVNIPLSMRGPTNRYVSGIADSHDIELLHAHILQEAR
jgi:hypothetical protein